jgi:protein-tyrosine-phosphatase
MRVLFVCSGNTCRSPLAEALFRRLVAEAGREDIVVTSAGTSACDGAPASEGAYLVALEQGLDLSAHRARLLNAARAAEADVVFTMGRGHLARVRRLHRPARAHLLGAYAGAPEGEDEVRDPFGGDVEIYRETFRQLETLLRAACGRLLAESPA